MPRRWSTSPCWRLTVLRFGIQPKVALLSHSSFGGSDPSARKMAER
jgi:phosphotransacetylase